MEYKDFVEYIKENAVYIAGEGGKITINHVIKNNGHEMDGLVIMEKGRDIAPTIYLDSFYEMYTQGENIKNIIRQIEIIYRENRDNITFDVNILKNFDTIQDKIVYKVVNYKSNEKLLAQVHTREYLTWRLCFTVCWITEMERVRLRLFIIIILKTGMLRLMMCTRLL